MLVTITIDDLATARDEGTVIILTGTNAETGDRVTFGADRRMALGLMEVVAGEGEANAEVEGWQVLHSGATAVD